IYRQVVDEIKGLIARRELEEGSSLPPVRQVAADLGVNLNTIAFAYRQLQNEGFIKVRHGSGAIVTSRVVSGSTEEQLRVQLRTALTQLALAGLKHSEIKTMVNEELGILPSPQG
nr:GntR family transcriptional regulator [Pyrinomonadaceae bacterium]